MLDKEVCKKLLSGVSNDLKTRDIEHFLIYGTCLGMIRENNFIDDDNDIDLGVFPCDKDKLEGLINDIKTQIDVKTLKFGKLIGSYRIYAKYIIDLVYFYHYKDKYYFIKGYDEATGEYLAKEFPEKYFDKLDYYILGDSTYKIPTDVESYLEYLYGEWRVKKPAGTSNLRELVKIKFEDKI